jgi:hypothetical protein
MAKVKPIPLGKIGFRIKEVCPTTIILQAPPSEVMKDFRGMSASQRMKLHWQDPKNRYRRKKPI